MWLEGLLQGSRSPGNDEEGIFTNEMQKRIHKPTESKELTEQNFYF